MKKTIAISLSLVLIFCAAVVGFLLLFYGDHHLVTVTKASLKELRSTVNTNGRIEPERIFELRAQSSGKILRIFSREGAVMKQGQAILEIDGELLRAELAAARADLSAAEVELRNCRRGPALEEINQAQMDVSRARLAAEHAQSTLQTNEWLLERGAISKYEVELSRRELARAQQSLEAATTHQKDIQARFDDFDRKRAETHITAARARIQYLEDTITKLTLRAPADGTLYQFQLKDGAYLNAGDLAGLFGDLTHLRLKALVDEPELSKIKTGSEVIISWNAYPGKIWKAIVIHVPPQVIAHDTRSVAEILCQIEKPGQELLPDIHVDVEIMMPQGPKVIVLPRETIFSEGRKQFVWIVRDGRARKFAVEAGHGTSTQVEVVKGISLDDQVIIPGETPINDGMKILIAKEQASHESP